MSDHRMDLKFRLAEFIEPVLGSLTSIKEISFGLEYGGLVWEADLRIGIPNIRIRIALRIGGSKDSPATVAQWEDGMEI